jgi:hypothetical protein
MTQAAARAILNAETCGTSNHLWHTKDAVFISMFAGYNQKKRYCGEVSGALYKYAEQSHTPSSCRDMQRSGELERLGCCVSTFVTTLKDMNSTALG